jgi:hypothetical protein
MNIQKIAILPGTLRKESCDRNMANILEELAPDSLSLQLTISGSH